MKRSLLVISLFVSPVQAEIVDSIEKFTDIFGVSFSKDIDGSTVTTLDASYDVTEKLRVFGDIDTESNWEAGIGYSFWQGEGYYTENSLKISDGKYSTGIFIAKSLHEKWVAIGDVNYNNKKQIADPFCGSESTCGGNHLNVIAHPSDSVDYSIGAMWSPIELFDLVYKFNHEVGLKENYISFDKPITVNDERLSRSYGKTNYHYHEAIVYLNAKYIRPSITYTYFEGGQDYIEFGLTFDF
ncbi:hypothetical protein L4C54_15840 [Vibrio lamellibrachiae]|uniref:hypothetical protein n=1 Tax=Vibrio lamellibrachiae TaxID=2910253 RepID=UPI003D1048E6